MEHGQSTQCFQFSRGRETSTAYHSIRTKICNCRSSLYLLFCIDFLHPRLHKHVNHWLRPNNSFKPTPHRGVNSVLYATLHAVAAPLRVGLTQALGPYKAECRERRFFRSRHRSHYSSATIVMPHSVTCTRAFWPTVKPAACNQSPLKRKNGTCLGRVRRSMSLCWLS